jgi:coenzyme F420-dependent glucose-6-phosphate dehydrogenase
MFQIGYHASHEQFAPSELLANVQLAEAVGFDTAKSSDHFHPWSERQAQSGFAWSWLGAAMQATRLPFGIISAPGYRYHPAILAQAAATIGEMFPDRLWLALGSGEALNEAITGIFWPDKAERNARLLECVEITRALFAGETVTHRGRVTVIEAKLYSRPSKPVPIYGAAISEATAEWCGSWADGLLTSGGEVEATRKVVEAFRRGGGEGKPVHLQAALSWAPTADEAMVNALDQWAPVCLGGEVAWDLRRPADFDMASKSIGPGNIADFVRITPDPGEIAGWLQDLGEIGPVAIHLLPVGRNQRQFLEMCGDTLLPSLRR